MLQGVNAITQKCQPNVTPKFLQGVMLRTQQCHTSITSKGAIPASRQRHFSHAPASFIWCQTDGAEMPWTNRTKGRVIRDQQRCLSMGALPNQFNGDTDMTQQCLDHNSPRERSWKDRRNAAIVPPLPTSLTGAITTSQKCYKVNAPREGQGVCGPSHQSQGATVSTQKCHITPAPTEFGSSARHSNVIAHAPNNQRPSLKLRKGIDPPASQHKKENKWTRDTKTQQSQRYSLHGATARTWSEQRAS